MINNRHFWRGLIDGDGYIGSDKNPTLALHGSKKVAAALRDYVYFITGVKNKVYDARTCYKAAIGGRNAAKVVDVLYKDASVYLDRKKIVADALIERYYD